jgi:hypothetical protein
MASIHPYRTKRGERRYDVRYRDSDGRRRSRAFSTLKDAHAFKLEAERTRPAIGGKLLSHKAEGRRFFNESEVRQWLRSRRGAGR